MGYRHYLNIVKKQDFLKINNEYIENLKDDEGYFYFGDIFKNINAEEICELGKYSDEGYNLETKHTDVIDDLKTTYYLLAKLAEERGYGFNILTKEDLIWIIEQYRDRTTKYWEKLVSDEPLETYSKVLKTPEEKCKYYVEDLLHWKDFICNTNINLKWELQTTWKYEYEMFNLIHCLKMIDWDNYILILTGY